MTALVRNFFTNTGLKGSPIKQNKPKLSVAFTAVRNEAGEQVVQFGVSSCHPNDHAVFKRKTGLALATSRLALEQKGESSAETGTITYPAGTTLDQIPGLIVKTYNEQVRKAKSVKWKAKDEALKTLNEAYRAQSALLGAVYTSPEFLELRERIENAEAVLYGDSENDYEDENV